VTLAADPVVRAFALRALADRRGELSDTTTPLFVKALADADPRVTLEAISGLRRLGAVDAAAAMLPLTASRDPVIANVAINALAGLAAIDAPLAALKGSPDEIAAGALRVLQQIHQPAAVTGLLAALSDAPASRRNAILQALARLHYREGVWRGTLAEWWGTRPDTTGPYYDPVVWEESARIRSALLTALLEAAAGTGPRPEFTRLAADLERNRVLPPGGEALLTALGTDRHALFGQVARALMGKVRLDVDATIGQLLEGAARAGQPHRVGVIRLIVAAGPPTPPAAAILFSAAVDQGLDADLRASAFSALSAISGPEAFSRTVDAMSSLVAPTLAAPLEPVWTQFISAPRNAGNMLTWRALVESSDPARQRLGFAVLLQLADDPPAGRGAGGTRGGGGGGRGRAGIAPEAVDRARADARAIIDGAWTSPSAASLVWAVGRTEAARYRDRVESLVKSTDPAIRDAAVYARTRLTATAPPPATGAPAADRPTIATIPYDDLLDRLAGVTGDVPLGRKLFVQQSCSVCHTTSANEPEKGPFLGGIYTRYSKAEVLEAILRPSAKVAQGFATHVFTMADKRQLSGFVIREGQDEVVIRDLAGVETTLRKSAMASRTVSEGSVMLRGLVDTLTLQELASLLAFLESTSAK
jgi:putative heme-binding domain-containing protein